MVSPKLSQIFITITGGIAAFTFILAGLVMLAAGYLMLQLESSSVELITQLYYQITGVFFMGLAIFAFAMGGLTSVISLGISSLIK